MDEKQAKNKSMLSKLVKGAIKGVKQIFGDSEREKWQQPGLWNASKEDVEAFRKFEARTYEANALQIDNNKELSLDQKEYQHLKNDLLFFPEKSEYEIDVVGDKRADMLQLKYTNPKGEERTIEVHSDKAKELGIKKGDVGTKVYLTRAEGGVITKKQTTKEKIREKEIKLDRQVSMKPVKAVEFFKELAEKITVEMQMAGEIKHTGNEDQLILNIKGDNMVKARVLLDPEHEKLLGIDKNKNNRTGKVSFTWNPNKGIVNATMETLENQNTVKPKVQAAAGYKL